MHVSISVMKAINILQTISRREEYGVTAKVIRAINTCFTKAVSELVVEESSQNSQHKQVI